MYFLGSVNRSLIIHYHFLVAGLNGCRLVSMIKPAGLDVRSGLICLTSPHPNHDSTCK